MISRARFESARRALAVRLERGLDARFFLGRQRRRFVFDSLDNVPARRELMELGRNVFAVPGDDSGAWQHSCSLQRRRGAAIGIKPFRRNWRPSAAVHLTIGPRAESGHKLSGTVG